MAAQSAQWRSFCCHLPHPARLQWWQPPQQSAPSTLPCAAPCAAMPLRPTPWMAAAAWRGTSCWARRVRWAWLPRPPAARACHSAAQLLPQCARRACSGARTRWRAQDRPLLPARPLQHSPLAAALGGCCRWRWLSAGAAAVQRSWRPGALAGGGGPTPPQADLAPRALCSLPLPAALAGGCGGPPA